MHSGRKQSQKHQLVSAPDVTNNANSSETGSRKANLEDDYDPTMVARDENKNAEKPALVSSNDTRKMYADSGRVQLGSNHPLGMTLSENIFKTSIGIETKSGLTKRASSEMESSPQEPYELPSKAHEIEAAKASFVISLIGVSNTLGR